MTYSGLLIPGSRDIQTITTQIAAKARAFEAPGLHLRHLIDQPGRFAGFSLGDPDFFMDFSRQRLDQEAVGLLRDLAREVRVLDRFKAMAKGEIVNPTEQRAALHTAARGSGQGPVRAGGMDVRARIEAVNKQIRGFVQSVHQGGIRSGTGSPFTHAVVVGIGGSYLGCEFAYEAMALDREKQVTLHFLANVDIDQFAAVSRSIVPESTLWIVVSKSYTTTETMANLNQVLAFLGDRGLSPRHHLVTVTAQGSPGDDPANPVLASFHMFDFIGGRYSVTSAVGGLPLSLAFGCDVFNDFLRGCRAMDTHVLETEADRNIPLAAALISVWNTVFLGYPAQAIIPYASRLAKLAPHVQQLYMESLGKSVSADNRPLSQPAGTIIFGEPGTNAQHSFFQLAHQGPAFPIDFIGVLTPACRTQTALSKGVSNHQELWANLLAQTRALATGRSHENPAQRFEGNRPSTLIVLNDLSPESVGRLLAFYEARTVLEGFILGVNPFDQFGVELGKIMANDIRSQMAQKNQDVDHDFSLMDDASRFCLDALFRGRLD